MVCQGLGPTKLRREEAFEVWYPVNMGGQGEPGTGTYRDWLQQATSQLLFTEEPASDAHSLQFSLPPSPAAPHP